LLPAILDLAQDGKWRIRPCVIQHIPLLAKHLEKILHGETWDYAWVEGDDIATIRQTAAVT
jgi:hypothetical protein